MKSISCLIGKHKDELQSDFGRDKAVTMSSGLLVWLSDNRVCCSRCGRWRKAKNKEDSYLPELIKL